MDLLKQTFRSDGLRIITKKLTFTKRVMLSFAAMVGSAHDPKDAKGLFHFFEHMAFQGTKTRSAEEIAAFLDRYCKMSNADTGELRTRYYGIAVKKNFEKLFDIISDVFCNSIFPEKEFAREKKVIGNEILMYEDDDRYIAFMNLMRLLYKHNPVREEACGTAGSLEKIGRDTIVTFHRQLYIPANSVVIATGDIEHDRIVEMVRGAMPEDHKKNPIGNKWVEEALELPGEKEKVTLKSDREMATIYVGCKVPLLPRSEWTAVNILAELIGGGESSPLYQELRQKRGLVYGAYGGTYAEKPLYQIIVFFAQTEKKNVDEVKKIIFDIVLGYEPDALKFEEIKEKRKEEAEIKLEAAKEWNESIMQMVVEREDIGRLDDYADTAAKRLDGITIDDIRKAKEMYLKPERMATSIVMSK